MFAAVRKRTRCARSHREEERTCDWIRNVTTESNSSLSNSFPVLWKRNDGLGSDYPHSYSMPHPSLSITLRIKSTQSLHVVKGRPSDMWLAGKESEFSIWFLLDAMSACTGTGEISSFKKVTAHICVFLQCQSDLSNTHKSTNQSKCTRRGSTAYHSHRVRRRNREESVVW